MDLAPSFGAKPWYKGIIIRYSARQTPYLTYPHPNDATARNHWPHRWPDDRPLAAQSIHARHRPLALEAKHPGRHRQSSDRGVGPPRIRSPFQSGAHVAPQCAHLLLAAANGDVREAAHDATRICSGGYPKIPEREQAGPRLALYHGQHADLGLGNWRDIQHHPNRGSGYSNKKKETP